MPTATWRPQNRLKRKARLAGPADNGVVRRYAEKPGFPRPTPAGSDGGKPSAYTTRPFEDTLYDDKRIDESR